MKNIITVVALFLVTLVAFAQKDDTKPYQTKTFPASGIKALNVRTSGGSITVSGQNGEAKVEVYVRGNSWPNDLSQSEIEDRLKEYDIIVKEEAGTIFCEAKRKNEDRDWNWKRSLSISFKVQVPTSTTTDLKTSGGSIHLDHLTGNQKFSTSGGSLHLDELSGNIKGNTSGGSIELTNCKDVLDLATSGGSIKADQCKGDIRLVTSGGSISLYNLDGTVQARTSGGSIKANHVQGELVTSTSGGSIHMNDIAASLKASTSGGSIEIEMTTLGKYLDLSTSSGGIRVQMPLNKGLDLDLRGNRVNVGSLSNFDGSIEKDRVVGRLNGGGTQVTMRASSGSVSINR
ncbi:MAG: DUF4097 family beta strand repeat-containing protein [Spirosomataceae bacterium]